MVLYSLMLAANIIISPAVQAAEIRTNELVIHNAPKWLRRPKVEKVTDKIQRHLEWATRRTPVYWHASEQSFAKAQSLGARPVAVTKKSQSGSSIHLSPRVTVKNYQAILGHELVHLIFYQKYKGAIPRWLEEGFANHLSRKTKVRYEWLRKQNLPADIRSLGHPFSQTDLPVEIHYAVSQAVVAMLDDRCDLQNLLRLSVQRKMADYIKTYCEINDINQAFKDWLSKKARLGSEGSVEDSRK